MGNLILENGVEVPDDIRVRLIKFSDDSAKVDMEWILNFQLARNPETDLSQEVRNAIRNYRKFLENGLEKNLETA